MNRKLGAMGWVYLILATVGLIGSFFRLFYILREWFFTPIQAADADIYVTGSNSRLMASEISTYLTGRYASISIYSL